MADISHKPPRFDAAFKARFADLVRWRRDVRRFRSDPIEPRLIESLLALASHAPSVGLSEPWRFVLVETPARRAAIRENFARANDAALNGYAGERQARYARMRRPRRAMASAARPCRRPSAIRSLRRSRHCGLRRAPKDWAWAGSRSSIPRRFAPRS